MTTDVNSIKELSELLGRLAAADLSSLRSLKSIGVEPRIVTLVEATRVVDLYSVIDMMGEEEQKLSPFEFNLMRWGWAKFLPNAFVGLDREGFPLAESTSQSRRVILGGLMHSGRGSLLERASDMVRYSIMEGEQVPDGYVLKMAPEAKAQFLDILEQPRYDKLMKQHSSHTQLHGWNHIHRDGLKDFDPKTVGNYFLAEPDDGLDEDLLENVGLHVRRLVKPWATGHGTMVGYDATPEVDNHFFALATRETRQWLREAGLHMEANLGDISGAELTHVVWYLASLHLKHIVMVNEAVKIFPEVSGPQSLTIWGPRQEMVANYAEISGHTAERAELLIKTITLNVEDVKHLERSTTPFIPLLLDLGNGYLLRPVSSIYGNPLLPLLELMTRRNAIVRNALEFHREAWMRAEVHAIFQGWKYQIPEGNFKLRAQGRLLTDIDGIVLDTETGDLAVFQFKWQDFFTNDVRQLRSRAKNFTEQMEAWATSVIEWFQQQSEAQVLNAFRLKARGAPLRRIFLFGMAQSRARMEGFGFGTTHPNLAICTWPQFARVRYEVGPGSDVIRRIHHELLKSRKGDPKLRPLPFSIVSGDITIHFPNLMNAAEEDMPSETATLGQPADSITAAKESGRETR